VSSFWDILNFIFHGILQYILFWTPVLRTLSVGYSPPWQWYRYNSFNDWYGHIDSNTRPDEHWIRQYLEMSFGEFKALVLREAKPYVDAAKNTLLAVTGYARAGFRNIADWSYWLERLFGYPLPWWASSVKSGLLWLRGKLPAGIREAWMTWDAIFDGIKNTVKNWATARYDQARQRAFGAYDWIVDLGDGLRQWRDRVAGWLDYVRNNPYHFIASALGATWGWLVWFARRPLEIVTFWRGPEWPKLLTFSRQCLNFYYNLWARGWRVLGDFIDNPLGFLYSRIEQMLVDRW